MKKLKIFFIGGILLFAIPGFSQTEKPQAPPPPPEVAPPLPPPVPSLDGVKAKNHKHPHLFNPGIQREPGKPVPPPPPPLPPPPPPPPAKEF